jgi:hypothetical protein
VNCALAGLIFFLLSGPTLLIAGPRNKFVIYWTDRGINSIDNSSPVIGGPKTVPIRMPSDKELPQDPIAWEAWAQHKATEIGSFLKQTQALGANDIEVLSQMDMKTGGYFADTERLQNVEYFMRYLGEAIDKVKVQQNADVIGAFGSEGSDAFVKASNALSAAGENPVYKAALLNGRASVQDTVDACGLLPGGCTIVTNKTGDYPALEMTMGDQFRRIANRNYAMEAADQSGGKITVVDTDAKGLYLPIRGLSSHVMIMNGQDRTKINKMRVYQAGKWSDWQSVDGDSLFANILNENFSTQPSRPSNSDQQISEVDQRLSIAQQKAGDAVDCSVQRAEYNSAYLAVQSCRTRLQACFNACPSGGPQSVSCIQGCGGGHACDALDNAEMAARDVWSACQLKAVQAEVQRSSRKYSQKKQP